jgi:hypothetical protein
MGLLSQYLAKTYLEVKQRPQYIVRDEGELREVILGGRQ